jgi:hypothetical protein
MLLEYASEKLKNDKDVCLDVVHYSYRYISESIQFKVMKDRLTTTKLSLLNAKVGAEYGLPDEMVEEVCKYMCPIRRIKGSCAWQFNTDDINLGMLY